MTPHTPATRPQSAPTPTRRRWPRAVAGERGAVTLEAAIALPTLLLALLLLAAAGRFTSVSGSIESAAYAAARAATLERSAGTARAAATSTATTTLSSDGVACRSRNVTIDTSAFAARHAAPGPVGAVTTSVTCVVPYGDLLMVPGLPGSASITRTATSALDTHRGGTT